MGRDHAERVAAAVRNDFYPPKKPGLILHGLVAALLSAGSTIAMLTAFREDVGANFVMLILAALALFAPLPLIIYRAYALLNARYSVERDGLRLRWGLRAEDIPLPEVEWLRPAVDLAFDLPMPPLSWPGALLGLLTVRDLGPVEYMAADKTRLLLVATPRRVYAISPADPVAFVRAFQYATEMGSITPIHSFSARPIAFLRTVWSDRFAQMLILGGLALNLALFILVSLTIPTLSSVTLGFTVIGQPLDPGPPDRLMLLPVLSAFMLIADLATGAFFYRPTEQRPIAYLVWAASILTSGLLIAAALFLTR